MKTRAREGCSGSKTPDECIQESLDSNFAEAMNDMM